MTGNCFSRLYGLQVSSPWPLPGPAMCPAGAPDVELFEGFSAAFAEAPPQPTGPKPRQWFHQTRLRDGSTYLRWTDLFDFVISPDGRRIACRPLARASQEAFQAYLLGQVLGFSLLKQGLEPLHATTVVVEGRAVAFLGDCGHGKSTLGAEFVRAGHLLLTDDILVLSRSGKAFYAHPGPHRLKLFPEVAKQVLGGRAQGVPMNNLTPKLILALQPCEFHDRPALLSGMYVLTPERAGALPRLRITIRPISQKNAVLELLRGTFNYRVCEPDRLQRQLRHAAEVASTIPIKRLSYPRRLAALPSVRERILADLAGGGR